MGLQPTSSCLCGDSSEIPVWLRVVRDHDHCIAFSVSFVFVCELGLVGRMGILTRLIGAKRTGTRRPLGGCKAFSPKP